jgi:ubiquinone/menaquinone biosynthesis C-methylase UbiE
MGDRWFLEGLRVDGDGIYGTPARNEAQSTEMELRERVAQQTYDDYLGTIARHHSVPVMDAEVRRFVEKIPEGGVICDVGGCWGWHWRHLAETRPDIQVVIVDFVKSNLHHARNVLGDAVNGNVWLVHGDACALEFSVGVFDGYWSVQTLQHVPRFEIAIREAERVLKPGGAFACYSLNNSPLFSALYRMTGREYITDGEVAGQYHLRRADAAQARMIADVFESPVVCRYSEILFKPEFALSFIGKYGAWLGRLDACLSGETVLFAPLARQRSFHTRKPA